MNPLWKITVYDDERPAHIIELSGPVELGRQKSQTEPLYSLAPLDGGGQRLVIARLQESTISREHAWLKPLAHDRFRLTNLSSKSSIGLASGTVLGPGCSCEVSVPTSLGLGCRTIVVEQDELESLQALGGPVQAPVDLTVTPSRFPSLVWPPDSTVDPAELVSWFKVTLNVLHCATTSSDFFAKAAQAAVEAVGLHSGRVLLWQDGNWSEVALATATNIVIDSDWHPSQRLLSHVREEKRTFWQLPTVPEGSLTGVEAVVAAPILNREGAVVGALYGDRRATGEAFVPITKLEALLVELLASGVAAGLARLEQEKAALAARVRFEQFFSAELAKQLIAQPDLLAGRDCEVTILFCDIRGFSRVSERLGPAQTIKWINDVLQVLSTCVLDQGGVLVDYVGDELLAMWGAPRPQADHAQRACRAALAMLDGLPELSSRWQDTIGQPLTVGIGLNTGVARVGNIGSLHKFKYGPLGNAVNLASRVQGASKYLRCSFLATQATQAAVGAEFESRRLCTVRVVNIAEPVNLYEIAERARPGWSQIRDTYQDALSHFENKEFRKAAKVLASLVAEPINDGPALVLMSRAVNSLAEGPAEDHPVWELPGK